MIYEKWFPTIISYSFNPNHNDIEEKLVKKCYDIKSKVASGGSNWISNTTYNTSDGMYDLFLDNDFEDLNSWVDSQVSLYCEELLIDKHVIRQNGWFNIYKEHDYQEGHVHPGSTISAIYCLSGEINSAEIFFKTPKTDMLYLRYKQFNNDNHGIVKYPFQPGILLIFLSDTEHHVGKHTLQTDRISISYNYVQVQQ